MKPVLTTRLNRLEPVCVCVCVGGGRLTDWNNKQNDQNIVTLCYTLRYHGNSRSNQAWSGWTWSNELSSSLQRSEGSEGGSIESGENKEADWSTNSKTPPTHHHPPKHPIGYLHHSQKKQSEPFSHWSPQPQAIQAVSPLVSFDNTPTVSHSAAANQVTVPVELSGITKRKKSQTKREE